MRRLCARACMHLPVFCYQCQSSLPSFLSSFFPSVKGHMRTISLTRSHKSHWGQWRRKCMHECQNQKFWLMCAAWIYLDLCDSEYVLLRLRCREGSDGTGDPETHNLLTVVKHYFLDLKSYWSHYVINTPESDNSY